MSNTKNKSMRYREMKSWDISSILRDVRSGWLRILLVAFSTAMLTYSFIAVFHTPVYTVSTTFAVSDSDGYSTSAYETAQKFQTILENNILKNLVAEQLGEENFEDNRTSMTAEVVPSTNLMVLSVTADSPRRAFKVLRAVLDNYKTVSDYVIDGINLETIEQPTISDVSSNQIPVQRYMVIAFLIGAAFVITLIVFDSHNRDTVKNESEFGSKIDSDLLGVIFHEKKSKKEMSMLLSNPMLSFRYVESYRMLASRVKGRMDSRGAKIVMVTSVLENEGKSTAASNLALALSQEQKNVLILDCDFRKPALHKIFEYTNNSTKDLTQYILGQESADGLIKKKKNSSIFFAFCYNALENSSEIIPNGNLKNLLDQFSQVMDYIIIDTPPMGLVADGEELIKLSDCAVLVVRQDTVLARDINDALDVLNQEEDKVLGCVFSNVLPEFGARLSGGRISSGNYDHYGHYGHYGRKGQQKESE